jgi:adenosylhomocysteine nucleosidase
VETIGLIAAMPQESAALLRYVKGRERISLGPYRGFHFQINDRNCVLILSGMGLSRAKDATRTLLSFANPDIVISFGIAGAVKDDLNIGDVVVAGNTCLLDKGLPGQLKPLATLSIEAWEAALQILKPDGIQMVSGTAITTRGSQLVRQDEAEGGNSILEMETAGVLLAANEMKIPLLSIRSISDGPRAPLPFDLEAILGDNDNIQIGKLLTQILRRPRIIFHSRQIMENSRKAADHAGRVVSIILRQPSPLVTR